MIFKVNKNSLFKIINKFKGLKFRQQIIYKKKNITINARNSGTLGRLISGILIDTTFPIKIIGDKSLSKRDFSRVTEPLKFFGANLISKNKRLPVKIVSQHQ